MPNRLFSNDSGVGFVTFGAAAVVLLLRGVVSGGAGGAIAPPDFGRSLNPISTRGGRLSPPNSTGTSRFSDPPTALITSKETTSEAMS